MRTILTVLCMALFLSGCKKEQSHEIGVIIPLSGNYSDVGQWMKMGIDLATEDLQAKYDIKVTPVYEDSQSDPNKAIGAYQKLKTTKQIKSYVSTVSSVCLALKPLFERDNNFLFVNAGHKDIINNGIDNIYRHALTIPQEAKFIANQIKKQEPLTKRIALLYTNNDIGVEFEDVFNSEFLNFTIEINKMSYEEQENNLKNIVHKLININPDIFVIYGYTKNFGTLIKTIRELNFMGKIYVNQGFSTPSVIENSGKAGNNVFYSDYDIPQSDEIEKLNKRSIQKYGQSLSPMSITSYNIMILLGTAIQELGDDPEKIVSYMKNLKKYDINGMHLSINQGDVYVPLKLVENKY